MSLNNMLLEVTDIEQPKRFYHKLKDFYQSLGFQIVTDIYLEDGIEHYGFELDLLNRRW